MTITRAEYQRSRRALTPEELVQADELLEWWELDESALEGLELWATAGLVKFFMPNVAWAMRCLIREVRARRLKANE